MSTELIRLRGVVRDYSTGDIVVNALKPLDMDVYCGEMLTIVGPSGSGKSTLLNILGGMDKPTCGEIWFENSRVRFDSDSFLTAYRRYQIGFVFQFFNLIPDLTTLENVRLSADLSKNPHDPLDVLRRIGLVDRVDHFPAQLSGGEQQRVAIARALVKNPKILLCDEPTGALDFETGKQVLTLLRTVNEEFGTTIAIVTHNSPIGALTDRVVKMRSGEIREVHVNQKRLVVEDIEW